MRFTLRTLLTLTSVVAIYLAIVFAMPAPIRLITVAALSCLVGPAVVTGIIYDCEYGRTFWIGCSATAIIPYLYIGLYVFRYGPSVIYPGYALMSNDSQIAYPLLACHAVILLSGLTAVAVRWLLIDSRIRRSPVSASSTTNELGDSRQ